MSALGEHVEPPPRDEADVRAQWHGVVARRRGLAEARRRRFATASAVAAVVLIAVAWWVGTHTPTVDDPGRQQARVGVEVSAPVPTAEAPPAPLAPENPPTPTAADGEVASLELLDGSHLQLEPGARVRQCELAEQDCLELDAGGIAVEVAERRPLEVRVGSLRMEATHATFTVQRSIAGDHQQAEVSVSFGVLTARRGEETYRLSEGESMTLETEPPVAAEVAKAQPTRSPGPTRQPPAAAEVQAGASLWSRARDARRSGDHAEAAELLSQLLQEHPRDAKAGLAALELGRLRMDTLDDTRGALAPLRRASRDRRRSVKEDALARLVRAHDELGETRACEKYRTRYLSRYPEGVHAKVIESACGGG